MHFSNQQDKKYNRAMLCCAVLSCLIALVFFIWYYSPNGSIFSLRYYVGASLVTALLVGIFSFAICLIILRFTKFRHQSFEASSLPNGKFDTVSRLPDPDSNEEKIRNPQPLSEDLYFDYLKVKTPASWRPEN